MNHGAELLSKPLNERIEKAIDDSKPAWEEFVRRNLSPKSLDKRERPLAMKYTGSDRAKNYLPPRRGRIFIGQKDFTWGRAVYVTGVDEPLSTAIYGRVGLVSWFLPDRGWKVLDARDPAKASLYLEWLKEQPTYDDAILTVHTNHWLHGLRNDFREQFAIDLILCKPDETDRDGWYTKPHDTWACVSDWEMGPAVAPAQRWLARYKYSKRFPTVRLTIVAEEEFVGPKEPTDFRPPDPPGPRVPQLTVSGNPPAVPVAPNVWEAYWRKLIARIPS
jgi:hypothetical protein